MHGTFVPMTIEMFANHTTLKQVYIFYCAVLHKVDTEIAKHRAVKV